MTRDVLMRPPVGAVSPRYNDRTPADGEPIAVLSQDVEELERAGWVRVEVAADEEAES